MSPVIRLAMQNSIPRLESSSAVVPTRKYQPNESSLCFGCRVNSKFLTCKWVFSTVSAVQGTWTSMRPTNPSTSSTGALQFSNVWLIVYTYKRTYVESNHKYYHPSVSLSTYLILITASTVIFSQRRSSMQFSCHKTRAPLFNSTQQK